MDTFLKDVQISVLILQWSKTHPRPLLGHGEIEFILISLCNLLLETSEAVLLRMVISGTLDIVRVLF
jgi:hypothetical protein